MTEKQWREMYFQCQMRFNQLLEAYRTYGVWEQQDLEREMYAVCRSITIIQRHLS